MSSVLDCPWVMTRNAYPMSPPDRATTAVNATALTAAEDTRPALASRRTS
jgi:hypothetical protein